MAEPGDVYEAFKSRMEEDLTRWEDRLQLQSKDLEAYKQTLKLIGQGTKLKVDLGSNFFMNAKLINNKLIIKMLDDIYVELTHEEAKKIIPSLIGITQKRVQSSENMIAYIMASREEVEIAVQKFSS